MGKKGRETELLSLKYEIYRAARNGQGKRLVNLLWDLDKKTAIQRGLNHYTKEDGEHTTPLIIAARNGRENVVSVLLDLFCAETEQAGTVKFEIETIKGATALWSAAAAGHLGVVKVLVEYGANVNYQTYSGSTPVRAACFIGRLDVVNYLVKNGADFSVANNKNTTCLMVASHNGHSNVVDFLVDKGAGVNSIDHSGSTALYYSAKCGHLAIVKLLIKNGAKLTKNKDGLTPLTIAALKGKHDVVQYLIKIPQCNRKDRVNALELLATSYTDGETYDIDKCYRCLWEAMTERYDNQAEIEEKDVAPPVPAYGNRIECKTLAELNNIQNDRFALHMECLAIRERILGSLNPEIPDLVIYAGAVFGDDQRYKTCIELWVHAFKLSQKTDTDFSVDRFSEVFAEMIHSGVDVDFRSIIEVFKLATNELNLSVERINQDEQNTDLVLKNYQDNILACIYLIGIMFKISKTEKDENDLHRAIYNFNRQNPCTETGLTPLHMCCDSATNVNDMFVRNIIKFPDALLCKTLIACGANVNALDKSKNSPLHIIARCADRVTDMNTTIDIILSLIENGVHTDIRNLDGETPIDVATLDIAAAVIRSQSKVSLKCLAARVLKRYAGDYKNTTPIFIQKFVDLH